MLNNLDISGSEKYLAASTIPLDIVIIAFDIDSTLGPPLENKPGELSCKTLKTGANAPIAVPTPSAQALLGPPTQVPVLLFLGSANIPAEVIIPLETVTIAAAKSAGLTPPPPKSFNIPLAIIIP